MDWQMLLFDGTDVKSSKHNYILQLTDGDFTNVDDVQVVVQIF